jgi:hypothetical protein
MPVVREVVVEKEEEVLLIQLTFFSYLLSPAIVCLLVSYAVLSTVVIIEFLFKLEPLLSSSQVLFRH